MQIHTGFNFQALLPAKSQKTQCNGQPGFTFSNVTSSPEKKTLPVTLLRTGKRQRQKDTSISPWQRSAFQPPRPACRTNEDRYFQATGQPTSPQPVRSIRARSPPNSRKPAIRNRITRPATPLFPIAGFPVTVRIILRISPGRNVIPARRFPGHPAQYAPARRTSGQTKKNTHKKKQEAGIRLSSEKKRLLPPRQHKHNVQLQQRRNKKTNHPPRMMLEHQG